MKEVFCLPIAMEIAHSTTRACYHPSSRDASYMKQNLYITDSRQFIDLNFSRRRRGVLTAHSQSSNTHNFHIRCQKSGDIVATDNADDDSFDSRIHQSRVAIDSSRGSFWTDGVREVLVLAAPALMSQAIEPTSQIMDTSYVGKLGSIELAAMGVSVSIFNLASKVFNVPLLNMTTSFVAEDDAVANDLEPYFGHSGSRKRVVPAVSSALFLASIIAIVETAVLLLGNGCILTFMGVPMESPMRTPASIYLVLRALGAPANVLSLAIQGIFRGFKNTRIPLFAIAASNIFNISLAPILMFALRFGLVGAALGTVASQYFMLGFLIWNLNKEVVLVPPSLSSLRFARFIKSGGYLLCRTMAVLFTMTFATSMAARQGAIAMAGHQIIMQIWLATSLLSDALALAGQALLASAYGKGDLKGAKDVAFGILQMSFYFGVFLALMVSITLRSATGFFTKDPAVKAVIMKGILFAAGTQPLNALAFVFDGIHYGVSDFKYAAYSMMLVCLLASVCLYVAPSHLGLPGVWLGLSVLMGLRATTGWLRLNTATGPWKFLRAC